MSHLSFSKKKFFILCRCQPIQLERSNVNFNSITAIAKKKKSSYHCFAKKAPIFAHTFQPENVCSSKMRILQFSCHLLLDPQPTQFRPNFFLNKHLHFDLTIKFNHILVCPGKNNSTHWATFPTIKCDKNILLINLNSVTLTILTEKAQSIAFLYLL